MTTKYYVETREYTGRFCHESVFHYDMPFDTLDEAKAWALTKVDTKEEDTERIRIYSCINNAIKVALFSDDFGVTWELP